MKPDEGACGSHADQASAFQLVALQIMQLERLQSAGMWLPQAVSESSCRLVCAVVLMHARCMGLVLHRSLAGA